jgi:hypothetical protein
MFRRKSCLYLQDKDHTKIKLFDGTAVLNVIFSLYQLRSLDTKYLYYFLAGKKEICKTASRTNFIIKVEGSWRAKMTGGISLENIIYMEIRVLIYRGMGMSNANVEQMKGLPHKCKFLLCEVHMFQIIINKILDSHGSEFVFWHVAPRSLVEIDRRFRDAYCLHPRPHNGGSKHL